MGGKPRSKPTPAQSRLWGARARLGLPVDSTRGGYRFSGQQILAPDGTAPSPSPSPPSYVFDGPFIYSPAHAPLEISAGLRKGSEAHTRIEREVRAAGLAPAPHKGSPPHDSCHQCGPVQACSYHAALAPEWRTVPDGFDKRRGDPNLAGLGLARGQQPSEADLIQRITDLTCAGVSDYEEHMIALLELHRVRGMLTAITRLAKFWDDGDAAGASSKEAARQLFKILSGSVTNVGG